MLWYSQALSYVLFNLLVVIFYTEQKTTLVAKKGDISSPGDENILQVVTCMSHPPQKLSFLDNYEVLTCCSSIKFFFHFRQPTTANIWYCMKTFLCATAELE